MEERGGESRRLMVCRFAVIAAGETVWPAHARSVEQLLALGATCELAIIADGSPRAPGGAPLPASSAIARIAAPRAGPLPLGRDIADRIRALDLDFVLDCSARSIVGEALEAPRHGVWSWFYGAGAKDEPCLREIYSSRKLIEVTLEWLGSRRGVLRRAVVNTDLTSYRNTVESAVAAGVDLPAWCAKRLADCGRLEPEPPAGPRQRLGAVRRGIARLRLAASWAASQVYLTLMTEMWNVGIVRAPVSSFLDPGYIPDIQWLPAAGPGRFYADPFVIAHDRRFEVLVEEFDYARNQGYIASVSTCGREFERARVLIDEGVHMSYPFPLRYGDDLYCIPESRRNRSVALYRFYAGESVWRRVQTLIDDFAALDSTIIEHDGRWWLFCTCQDDLPECKLYLWHAADLFGPWQPHGMNPVKCDVRSSRPGGMPFWWNGSLYRPAQDSSASYGGALTINRVLELSADRFEEEPVVHIDPPRLYPHGIHTLSGADGITVLDGKRMTFIPDLALRRLRFKLGRLAGRNAVTGAQR
jgi:hypothetical protein